MATISDSRKEQLASLYQDRAEALKSASPDQEKIRSLSDQIMVVLADLAKDPGEDDKDKSGMIYLVTEGIYRLISELLSEEKTFAKTARETGDVAGAYTAWQREQQKKPITGKEWYNREQVACLTGGDVPAGRKELGAFLKKNAGNLPLFLAYLTIPDEKNPDENHYISFHVSKDNKITWLDSNGQLMSAGDEAIFKTHFPGAEVVYRNQEGGEISQASAAANPENILRVQYNNHDCGMYATELTSRMKAAGSANIDFAAVKALDSATTRADHQNHLKAGIACTRQRDNGVSRITPPESGIQSKLETQVSRKRERDPVPTNYIAQASPSVGMGR